MNGNKLALDTNQAIAILNREDEARKIQTFTEIYLPVPVVGELRFGALNSQKSEANLERISHLVNRCHAVGINLDTAEIYARIRLHLKQKGRPIPENDLWIAAICVQHAIPLATADDHFSAIEELTVIDW